jgi:hypothetical protein
MATATGLSSRRRWMRTVNMRMVRVPSAHIGAARADRPFGMRSMTVHRTVAAMMSNRCASADDRITVIWG